MAWGFQVDVCKYYKAAHPGLTSGSTCLTRFTTCYVYCADWGSNNKASQIIVFEKDRKEIVCKLVWLKYKRNPLWARQFTRHPWASISGHLREWVKTKIPKTVGQD